MVLIGQNSLGRLLFAGTGCFPFFNRYGQGEIEQAAVAGHPFALDADLAAQFLDDTAHDGKPAYRAITLG